MALSVGILPSLAIGACAFGAGELILRDKKNNKDNTETETLNDILIEAKIKTKQIQDMISKVESVELQNNINEIGQTSLKIIESIEKNPEKYKKMRSFFDYYLPVTLSIVRKYDEIENQKLTSADGEKFMKQTENMVKKINKAFKNQLSNLYQTDMVDTDAEMKVFEAMLKADGYDTSSDFENKE